MEWQSVVDWRKVDAIQEIITNGVECRLAIRCPIKRYGLAIVSAGEGREGFDDLSISTLFNNRNIAFGLDENAEDVTQFREVSGRNHFADGIEVLVGKTVALIVGREAEECNVGETKPGLGRVKGPVVVFAHLKVISPSFDKLAIANKRIIAVKQEVALCVVVDIARGAIARIIR